MKFFLPNKLVGAASGFSLIELLIVIAILGVLSTFVFVSLNSCFKFVQATHSNKNITNIAIANKGTLFSSFM